jgi:hypothetical protein
MGGLQDPMNVKAKIKIPATTENSTQIFPVLAPTLYTSSYTGLQYQLIKKLLLGLPIPIK